MVSYLDMPHKTAKLIQEALRACHVPSAALGAGDPAVKKTLPSDGAHVRGSGRRQTVNKCTKSTMCQVVICTIEGSRGGKGDGKQQGEEETLVRRGDKSSRKWEDEILDERAAKKGPEADVCSLCPRTAGQAGLRGVEGLKVGEVAGQIMCTLASDIQ